MRARFASQTEIKQSRQSQIRPCISIMSLVVLVVTLLACDSQNFGQTAQNQAFSQTPTYSNKIDVLWVVDTSGNMTANQQAVVAQIPSFINSLNQTGLDYQIAVTTMDMSAQGDQGKFLSASGPAVLTDVTPNMGQLLSSRIFVGDYAWHPLTRGLQAMQAALSAPNSTVNPGFIRTNSLLVVIFVTASNDQSPAADYTAWLNQLKPPTQFGQMTWVAQFMGVMPGDPNCQTTTWQYNSPGTAYIALASASGGAAVSICSGNLSSAMTNVGQQLLSLATAYPLAQLPNPNSISVVVNGTKVANDATNGWTYVKASNSIQFHGTAIPPAGASIVVNFQPGSAA